MEVKRIFKKEQRYIETVAVLIIFIAVSSIIIALAVYKYNNYFKDIIESKNYNEMYESIDNPDFSIGIFKKYFDENFGSSTKFISKTKNKSYTIYTFYGNSGTKIIKTVNKGGKIKWIFDDYVYNWVIKLPPDANILISGDAYDNQNGEVNIKKIPTGIYEVKCSIPNVSNYDEKISAGQNIDVKMNMEDSAVNSIQTIIKKFMAFKQDALNGKVESIDFIDKNSGLYNEITEQSSKMGKLDYKISYELKDFNIGKIEINSSGDITANVNEKWNTIIENDAGKSENINEYKNIYYFKYDGNFIIKKVDAEN